MTRPVWLGSIACMALAVVGLTTFGRRRWARRTQALQGRLDASLDRQRDAQTSTPTRYRVRELEGLPAPVQRFFRAVLEDGQPIVTGVAIDMAGIFNMSATGARWRPFTSRQRVVTRRPGFLWDARISMLPGLPVDVVDSYILGKGGLQAAILGIVDVADVGDEGEIARGEFMRWFAEAAWYPTALLPSQGVRWDPVDDRSAHATVEDGSLRLTMLFRFDDAGPIRSFRAEARGGMVGNRMVMAPWEGSWSNDRVRDGMTVPFTGEVAWMRPEGRRPYFVGRVTALTFRFAP